MEEFLFCHYILMPASIDLMVDDSKVTPLNQMMYPVLCTC